MPVQASLLDEVLALAKGLKSLRPDQLAKIQKLAPGMDEGGLEKLKGQLEKIEQAQQADLKEKTDVLKHAASAHKEWEADKARVALEKAETAETAHSQEEAEDLLSTLK